MHKKLEAELVSIAHQILQMKDKNDVVKLKNKAKEVYEKLSVLDFVNNYFLTTPQATEDKNEVLEEIDKAFSSSSKGKSAKEKEPLVKKEQAVKQEANFTSDNAQAELDKVNAQNAAILKAEADKIAKKIAEREQKEAERLEKIRLEAVEAARQAAEIKHQDISNNDDFKDSIPADVAANLFEKASKTSKIPSSPVKKEPVKATPAEKKTVAAPTKNETPRSSLNDRILTGKIQVGLNDRIAFVKHLFNFSQEEFNRVLSQLNSFTSEQEAKDFIINTIQSDYDWTGKEEYVQRLFMLIERRFA